MDLNVKYFENPISGDLESELKQWKERYPEGGCLTFISEKNLESVPSLQKIFRDTDVLLAGAVFPMVIFGGEFREGAVFIFFTVMPRFTISKEFSSPNPDPAEVSANIKEYTANLLKHVRDEENTGFSLFLIFDSMLSFIATAVNQIFVILEDRVSYSGVNAGSETFQSINCIFDRERFAKNSILALLFSEELNPFLDHGYNIPDQIVAATSTDLNRIISIDWKPAFQMYQALVDEGYHIKINEKNFYKYAVHFPFGIIFADGEVCVRIPVQMDDDGSLHCVGEVPENSIMTLLIAPGEESFRTAKSLLDKMTASKISRRHLMMFYCAGRKMHLGSDKSSQEVNTFRNHFESGNVFGALSLGEIGSLRTGGIPLFHNATIVCIPL